jgi:hypothetical protein
MSDLSGGDLPVAHNTVEGSKPSSTPTTAPAPSLRSDGPYGVAHNANEFRRITSNNADLTDTAKSTLLSVLLVQEINVPTMCQMVFDVDAHWGEKDFKQFQAGTKLTMPQTLPGQESIVPLYSCGMKLDATPTETTLTVTAFDAMHFLRIGAYTRSFVDEDGKGMTDERIFEDLAGSVQRLGFSSTGLSGQANGYVLQDNETNYDFLMRRCRDANYECMIRVDGGKEELFVRGTVPSSPGAPPPARPTGPTLVFKQEIEHISLDMRLPVLGSAVTTWGYDVSSGKAVMGHCDENASSDEKLEKETGFQVASVEPLPASPLTVRRPDLAASDALDFIAKAERAYRQAAFIVGEATLRTINFEATAGLNVNIKGVNGQFDGRYCVVKSMHRFDESANHTVLTLRRSGK